MMAQPRRTRVQTSGPLRSRHCNRLEVRPPQVVFPLECHLNTFSGLQALPSLSPLPAKSPLTGNRFSAKTRGVVYLPLQTVVSSVHRAITVSGILGRQPLPRSCPDVYQAAMPGIGKATHAIYLLPTENHRVRLLLLLYVGSWSIQHWLVGPRRLVPASQQIGLRFRRLQSMLVSAAFRPSFVASFSRISDPNAHGTVACMISKRVDATKPRR